MEEIRDPELIYHRYLQAAAKIMRDRQRNNCPYTYTSLADLERAFRTGLSALSETAELMGLNTANIDHFEDVGLHTLRVVTELSRFPEYASLSPSACQLLNISAYLHDIGKGPKSRWEANGGLQQVDAAHPEKALPMLERILGTEIKEIDLYQIDLILRLVTYHDLPGLILLGRRTINDAFRILRSPEEVDLLILLSRADARSINPEWERAADREKLRSTLRKHLF